MSGQPDSESVPASNPEAQAMASEGGLPAAEVPAEESPGDPVAAELAESRKKLREAEARLRTVSKAYTDLEAEMDAFRRRMNVQAEQRVERKSAELVEVFFDPVQNLKRSLAAGDSDTAALMLGLQMFVQQFNDALSRLGLQEVPGVGALFDPAIHEALAVQPVSDAAQDGKVLMVHATGYRVAGKVLQPAQVVIGKLGDVPQA